MVTFEQAYERIPGNGWLSKGEAKLLWEEVAFTEGGILEVGCYQGRSTCLLAQTGRTVIAVDPFYGFTDDGKDEIIRSLFLANIAQYPNVVHVHKKVEDWEPVPCGFCYLDGDHTYEGTIAQIKKALECKPRGIAVHDVNDSGQGVHVKRAALELLGDWKARVERLAVWNNG
jgi:SAM-dependent methyltransferase